MLDWRSDAVMTRDEINAIMPADRTNMDLLPASVKELRIVQIGDRVDMCPCAGTHVSNIGELGHIQFLGKKSKGKERSVSATPSRQANTFVKPHRLSCEQIRVERRRHRS